MEPDGPEFRDVYDVVVPGLVEKSDEDPVRKKLRRYSPAEVRSCVEPLPPPWTRIVQGCVVCAHDNALEDFAGLRTEFDAKWRMVRCGKFQDELRRSKRLSIRQQQLIARFYNEDNEPQTLCPRHLERVLGASEPQIRLAVEMRERNALLAGDEELDEDSDGEVALLDRYVWDEAANARMDRMIDEGVEDDDDDDEDYDEDVFLRSIGVRERYVR